jgi:Fe-S cluster biosynthesis and repair protein YggX
MNAGCITALEGRQTELPGKKPKRIRPLREATLLIAQTRKNGSTAVLVERRPSSGLWGGLWSPPQFESKGEALAWCRNEFGDPSESHMLPAIDHAFTHFDLRLNPLQVRCDTAGMAVHDGDVRLWYQLEAPPRIGLPQPIRRLFERLRTAPSA